MDEEQESEQESEESNNDEEEDERPAKRRKLDSSEQIQDEINQSLRKGQQASSEEDEEEEQSSASEHHSKEPSEVDDETKDRLEEEKRAETQRVESIKTKCEEIFKEEPSVVWVKHLTKVLSYIHFNTVHKSSYEPLSLMEAVLNFINKQNMPDFEAQPYKKQSTKCQCKICGEEFQNVKILALHEPHHMEVEFEERIDNPEPWPGNRPYAKIRNKWLTFFDESG